MTKETALLRCSTYDDELVYNTIAKLFELVPPPDVRGKTLLLKPNILQPKSADYMICTHPVVVGAVVKHFVERGAKTVLVGESPATSSSLGAAKASGIYEAVQKAGGTWVNFDKAREFTCGDCALVKSFNFAEPFFDADMIITLPKLKTHQLLSYTGAMKNLFGLMIGLQKAETHFRFPNPKDFAAFLTDINVASKPVYAIMDGIVAMEGHGPASGNPHAVGVLGASCNVLALDWVCSSLIGYNPHTILNLEDALARGIWGSNPQEFVTLGDDFESLKPKDFKLVKNPRSTAFLKPELPKWIHRLSFFIFSKYPTFSNKKCIRCGQCAKICPPHALCLDLSTDGTKNKTPRLNKDACIHCYCCHEVCPVDAIKLRHLL